MMPRFARSRTLSTVVPARVASSSSSRGPEGEGTAPPSIGAGTPATPEAPEAGSEESGREIASPVSATAAILQTPHEGIGKYRSNGANGAVDPTRRSRSRDMTGQRAATQTLPSFDPATGAVVGEVRSAMPDEVRRAVARARAAQPGWAALSVQERARWMGRVRRRMNLRMDEVLATICRETGKPRAEAVAHDVLPSLLTMAYLERIAPRALRSERVGTLVAPVLGLSSRIEWRPFGVVGCIAPWNYPMFLAFMGVVPALLAGNAVVLKPSELTPEVGEVLRDLLEALPEGLATVVQGGGEIGAALVDAPCDKL